MEKKKEDMEEKVTDNIKELTLEEIKELNLWEKMALITAEIGKVYKDLKIDMSSTKSYKAVSEGAVLNAVKEMEEKYRVYSYPMTRSVVDRDIVTTSKTYNGETKESNQFFMRVEVRYFFVNIDNPEQSLQVMSYGDGLDSGDKASGKAMTYADKYALMKAYKIETGEDPDAEGSPDLKGSKSKEEKQDKTPISAGQIATLVKWATTPERKTNILNELTVMCNRAISEFEDLTLKEASDFIKKVVDKSKKNKEENNNA